MLNKRRDHPSEARRDDQPGRSLRSHCRMCDVSPPEASPCSETPCKHKGHSARAWLSFIRGIFAFAVCLWHSESVLSTHEALKMTACRTVMGTEYYWLIRCDCSQKCLRSGSWFRVNQRQQEERVDCMAHRVAVRGSRGCSYTRCTTV